MKSLSKNGLNRSHKIVSSYTYRGIFLMDVSQFTTAVSKFTETFHYSFIPVDEVIVHYGNSIDIKRQKEFYPLLAFIYRNAKMDISLLGRGECEFVLNTPTHYFKLMFQNGSFRCESKILKV